MPAPGSAEASRLAKHRRRKALNAVALTLSMLAMAFGLFWLIWILWETLPEGEVGLRPPPGGGRIAEEQSVTRLSDGSLFCVYRTVAGHPATAYSRDGGRTWGAPAFMTYTPGGRRVTRVSSAIHGLTEGTTAQSEPMTEKAPASRASLTGIQRSIRSGPTAFLMPCTMGESYQM